MYKHFFNFGQAVKNSMIKAGLLSILFCCLVFAAGCKKNLEGVWQRTDVPIGLGASISISNMTADSFDVDVQASYYTHEGSYTGTARMQSDGTAILTDADYPEEEITFQWQDGKLEITSKNGGSLGFGANVSMDGTYVPGEPAYTNSHILEDTFSEEELTEIQDVMGEEYEEFFLQPITYGYIQPQSADGYDGRCYQIFFPTMGLYDFTFYMNPDGFFYYWNENMQKLLTNDTKKTEIPETLQEQLPPETALIPSDYQRYDNYLTSAATAYTENVLGIRDITKMLEPIFATDSIRFTKDDFMDCPKEILLIARNEIFARHGYIFKDTDLREYFLSQAWYRETISSEDFDDSMLTETEQANLDVIIEAEKELGYR